VKRLNIKGLNRMARAAQKGEKFVPGCSGKQRYRTREEAREVQARRREAGVKRLTLYKCNHCAHWHLTTHTKS